MPDSTDTLKLHAQGDVTIARVDLTNLTGLLDVSQLQQQFELLIENGARLLVIDLQRVRYAGSSVLGLFLVVQKKLAATNGRLVLAHVDSVEQLLRISQTDRILTVAPDTDSAVAILSATTGRG